MNYNLPLTLELEMPDIYGNWAVVVNKRCHTQNQVITFIERWKSLYALKQKSYKIYVVTPSKANKLITQINISDIIEGIVNQ
jgi:hypothetical protein